VNGDFALFHYFHFGFVLSCYRTLGRVLNLLVSLLLHSLFPSPDKACPPKFGLEFRALSFVYIRFTLPLPPFNKSVFSINYLNDNTSQSTSLAGMISSLAHNIYSSEYYMPRIRHCVVFFGPCAFQESQVCLCRCLSRFEQDTLQ